MSRFKRRNGDNAESERSNGVAMELPERESLLAADAPAPNEPAASSSRRSSPRAPNHNPPADVVAASKPVLSSPRATAQADMPTVSREGSRRDRPPRLELAAQPSSRSQLSRNNSNATPENDARPSPRVQIVTPGPSHRSVPPLPIETASGRLLSTSPGVDDGYTEPPNEPASGAGAVVKRQSQDVKGQEDRLERLRALHQTCCLSWVTGSFRYFRIGYDINPFYRKTSFAEANKGLDLRREGQGVQLSVIIGDIDTYKEHVAGLIRPIVRVHAVDLESGLYIRSADRDPAAPACTRPQLSFNSGSSASWTQELLLDAHYYDVVNERSLLLFEILDEKPSLSLDKNTREKQQYWKKVAWGYLLPVGSNGQLNVGVANRQVLGGGLGGQSARTPRIVTGRAKEDREPPKRPYHRNLRIQLYHYRRYDGLVGLIQRSMLAWPQLDPRYLSLDDASHPNGVPSAYLQWRLLQKNPVQGAFLTISIGPKAMKLRTPRLLGTSESEKSHTDDTDADNEDNDELLSPRSKAAAAAAKEGESLYERLIRRKKKRIKSKEESNKLRSASLRRVRRQEEPCVIPERFLRRLDVRYFLSVSQYLNNICI